MADTITNPLEPAVEGEPTYFPSKPAKEESPFLKPGQVIATLGEPAPTSYVDEGAIEKGKATEQLLTDAKKREQSKILQPPGDQWVYDGVTEQVEKAQPEAPPKKPPPPQPPTEPYEKEYKPEERLPTPPTWDQITSSPDWHKLDSDTKLKVIDRYTSDLKTMGHAEAERTQQDPKAYEAEADNFNKTERAKLESPLSILQNTGKEFDRGAVHKTAQLGVGLARGAKNVLYPELDLSDIGHMTVDQAKNELGELTKVNQPKYDELATQAREFLDKSTHLPGYFVNHPDEYFQGGKVGSMRFVPGPNGAIDVIQQAEANRRRIDALNTYVNSNGTEAPKQTAGEEFMQITGKLPEQASDAIKIDEVYKRNHPVAGRVAETIGAITPYVLSNLLTGGMGTVPAGLIPEAMGLSDAFQTQYEGAQAKLDEREAHGEHFTPYERERLALDDATRTSTGMGSFYALANMSLGGMMENVQTIPWLKTDLGETVTQNWLKYLLTGGIDTVAQGQIQAGASVIGNIGDRATGVDPRRKWYEGIGEAELTGMGFGLFGTGFRIGHALVESKKIGQLAQDATRQADDLLNSPAGTGITRNQALELTIAGATAQEPHYKDAVRARINLDAAGADEKKTAADIQDIAPETSKALDKDGDNTAGTSVTPVTKGQDQLQELRDRIKKKKEEREAAVNAAGAAGQAVAKGATTAAPPEEGETTQETRAAEAEKATSGPRELSPEEKAAREKRRKGINDQLDDYLGLDATDEDRKALVKDYLERNLYQNGTESTSEQRRSAAQLMHELRLDTREKLPDSWKTNTHESVAGMEQNFSDWLAGRIKERRETTETKVIPPETLAKGVAANDPTELRALLGQGKTMPLTDDEVEKYDDFFLRHNFDVNYDKNEKPYLALRPETEETLLPETAEPKVEKKKAERMDVALRQNSPEFAQGIAELEPHPYEKEHLEQAYRIVKGAGEARIDRQLKGSEKPDVEDVQAAAIFSYLQHLRRYAKRKRELGQEDQLVAPGEQLPPMSETAPEGEEAEPEEEEAAPAEKKEAAAPINKLPNIWQHINWVLKQYGGKRRAGKTINPEDVVRLNKAPLGLSEGSTLENVVAAQLEKNKAGITREEEAKERLEEEGVAAEEKAAPAEEGKGFRWSTLGSDDIVRLAKEFIPTLPEKDQRIGWYFLRHYNYITPDEVPEGVKGATNISRRELTRVARQIGDYIQRNYKSGPPPEAGESEGPPRPGGGGYPPPPGGGAIPAPPHPQPVLPGTELPGHPAGGPPPETGGREPAVRKEGEAAAGQPERVLPEERGGPGVGASVTERPPAPGGAGGPTAEAERGAPAAGERGGGAQRPGGATGASRERTIHVQERPGHERGGPNPTGSGNLPGGGSIAGAGVSAGGRGAGVTPLDIAEGLLKNPEVAEDHGIDVKDFNTPQELVDHLSELEDNHDDPEAWYKEMAADLGIKAPKAEAPPAVKPPPGAEKLQTILKTGALPPELAAAPGIITREDVSSNKSALEHLKTLRQLDADAAHVDTWPDQMRADYISKMGLTVAPTDEIPGWIPTMGDFAIKDPETGKITVGQSNYSAINKMGEAARKPNIIEGRIVDGKFVPDVGGVADKTAEVNAIRKSLQERTENTLNRMAKVLGRTPEEVNHFVRTLGEEELKPTKPKPKAPAAPVVDPVVQASDPARIAEATTPPLAAKINDYLKANPDAAVHWGINPGDDILARYRQIKPDATPEQESNFVQAMAQRLGLTDPPHDTDTAQRAGKMHSMKPGVAKAHAALTGDAQDLVNHLRTSTNPEEQAFARSLNAHARTLRGVYIYTADHPDPVIYMEGKNIWASPSVVDHPLGHLAAAQELQHVIAYKKLRMPQTSDEFESVAHWEYLRSRVESHLPAELRGELHTTFSDLFNKFDATGHLDNRALTPAEERYLPFMYAAQRGENLLNSVFNSRAYRDYLKALKEPDGRSVWDGIENWGKRIFGDQAFKYLNDVEPLTGNTPGIKYRGPMPDLTIAEQRAKRLFNKYRLNENNAQAALESVVKHTEDPRLKHVAEAMVNVAKQYPEITVGLQDRLGGDAGGYIFYGDHVMVNPNYSDGQIQHTIVHEMVHAFVNGKIKAFLNGQVHLVTAQDAAAITRLLDLRNYALKHPSIPKEMQQVAGHKTYGDRIDAYMDWAQKNPHAGDTYYGLTDLTEFATEALSNGKFQELLDKIPYTLKEAYGPTKPRTVLQKAFQFIRNLLGFKEDTVLSRAFEDVSKLMGGRRVMEADYNVGFLQGTRTLKAQENLMAKRELDRRAKEGGFDSTRDVPIDRLNQWVQEWRQGQGVASGVVDPTKTYTKTSRTDTRAQIQQSDRLSMMTRPADIIDHLANVTGTRHDDIESLNDVVRQAFKNKAINLDQFSKSMQALDQGSNEVYHRLHLDMGDEKDNHSVISRWTRFHHQWRPEGNLPKEAYEAMQKQVYESQATAFEIQNRWKDLRSALAKEWKISPSDVVKHNDIREALNNMLEGKPAGRTMPRSVIEATDAMRAAVERRSLNILDEDMVSGDKWAKIEENLGTYMARSYRLFDDPRFLSRPESQKYRSAAEKEVDTMLRGASRAKEARRIAENAREDAKRNFATGSTAGEDAGQKAYDAAYTDALANVGKHALDRMLANWEQRSENRETKMLQFGHAFGINDKLMARLTEMPENVRKLIGEERDPFARFANTIWRQQNFINTVRLSRDLARLGEEGGYITKRLTDTNNRQIPKGFSHLGDLAGRYTTPEIAGALTKFQENIEALPSSNPALNVIRQFESTARYTTTILSTMRSMANFHGMIFSHLNNGYWNPVPAWKPLRELLANKLAGMNNPQREEYLMDLYRRGLSDKESDINYMMDFLKSGPHITARTSQDLLEAFTDWWKKAGQATQKPRDWALNLHTVGNFISKASQYEQQIGRERAFNNWDVKYRGAERLNDEQLRDRAAQVVRETNISYSRASPFIREARKFPVIGTFLTYWEQSFRSYFGSAMHMYKNLLSDNPIRKWDGVARLAGMLTSTLLPAGLQALSQHMFGVSDAEDKHFRSLLPPWEQNQALFYGPMTDKGKRAYWNASYSTQQSDISRSIHALLSFRNNPDGVPGAIRDSIFESGRSFVNLGLVPGALVDLQRNQTEYGTQVYNPQDTWQNIVGDVTRHVMQRVAGGTIGRFGNKILPPLLHGGEYVSQSGAVYNWWSGLLPEVSGLNIKEISFPDRFRSEMYTSKNNFKNAEKLFTGPIMRSGNQMTDADMEEAYNRSEQARRKVFNNLRSQIEAARFGGMTTQQIRGTLHLRQFSHQMIDDLLSNRYHPYVPSKTIVGNAKANGNRLPARLFSRHAVFLEPEEGEEE